MMATLGAAAAMVVVLLTCAMSFPGGAAGATGSQEQKLYSETFRSPAITLGPGDVISKQYPVGMPRGHIALRSFDAQLVDEKSTPIPLSETYLHHWILIRHYNTSDPMAGLVSNAGVCQLGLLPQYYGLGSETRHTDTTLQAPYGIVIGDAESIPLGFEEGWILDVHAIDTRGTVDARGCTECVCELYNVTVDNEDIPAGYEGGLDCCHDETHCAVREGFEGSTRDLFMEYTVTWVNMTDKVVPVKIYILDVTDRRTASTGEPQCHAEYTVHKCPDGANECIHTAESSAFIPDGGDVVYAVAHQHSGGVGSTLYNENGAEICNSLPIYGNGSEAGNEAGYIVGMTTCYPEPGTVKVRSGEQLRFTSLYNSEQRHTGVMGLFYLVVASPRSPPHPRQIKWELGAVTILAVLIIIIPVMVGVAISRHRSSRKGGVVYESVL